ncbi:MAG: hypothetical protein HUJ13_09025 [Hydrogenovibrio crunogenus]|nr:hypothetical protein [Hydrogenovibrio crunogenus]
MSRLLSLVIATLMMASCASSPTLSTSSITPPKPKIEQAWLVKCGDVPYPQKDKAQDLLWRKALLLQYKDCKDRHNAWVDTQK